MAEQEQQQSGLSAGRFPAQAQLDRSALGLQYQHAQMDTVARGVMLGKGRRVAPDPSSLFSQPAMSRAQFGGESGNARASFGD